MKYIKRFKNESDYQTFRGGAEWITPNVSVIDNKNEIKLEPYYSNPLHITVELTNHAGIINEGSEQSTLLTEYLLNKYGYSFNGNPENCEIRINGYEITDLHITTSPNDNLTMITGILGSNMGEFGTYSWFVGVSPEWYVIL